MGEAHGRAMGAPIRGLLRDYFGKYFQSDADRAAAMSAASLFLPYIDAEHRAEIDALAMAASLDPREVLLAQCFLDLTAMTACSTVALPASASPDGVARMGRNLDFPSFGVAEGRSALLVFRPASGRFAFASVAWPGMIGVLSGINEHGLVLANMEVTRPSRAPQAMPYTLLYRSILERCRTVEQAIAFLRTVPRQTANNLMLMDAAGDRAVVEITPTSIHIRRAPADQPLVSTNHQRGAAGPAMAGRCARYDYLFSTASNAFGSIDERWVESAMARVAQGPMTIQSIVFEPSGRVIHLATGAEASSTTFVRIELGPLMSPTG